VIGAILIRIVIILLIATTRWWKAFAKPKSKDALKLVTRSESPDNTTS